MAKFEYEKRSAEFNGSLAWRLMYKRFGVRINFWEYADGRLVAETDRDLTAEEKAYLDSLVLNPPKVARYMYERTSAIAEAVGIEPIRVVESPDGTVEVCFERELTRAELEKLDAVFLGRKRRVLS